MEYSSEMLSGATELMRLGLQRFFAKQYTAQPTEGVCVDGSPCCLGCDTCQRVGCTMYMYVIADYECVYI